jgi:hypothetical protein
MVWKKEQRQAINVRKITKVQIFQNQSQVPSFPCSPMYEHQYPMKEPSPMSMSLAKCIQSKPSGGCKVNRTSFVKRTSSSTHYQLDSVTRRASMGS